MFHRIVDDDRHVLFLLEYAYGGHPYSYTGVYEMAPHQEVGVAGQGKVRFRQSLYLGHTSLTPTDVEELIRTMGKDYNGNKYHIFDKYVIELP